MADDYDDFGDDLRDTGRGLEAARGSLRGFGSALNETRAAADETTRRVTVLASGITSNLKGAFGDLVFEGGNLADAMSRVAQSISRAAYDSAVNPVFRTAGTAVASGVGGLLGGVMPFANGGAFTQGRVMPFATGGVVNGPTHFPMRGGMGLMGEAGPEAILPLARGADGRLGVRAGEGGGRPVQVVMNVSTPDAESFRRSQSQLAAQLGRALGRGQRNR